LNGGELPPTPDKPNTAASIPGSTIGVEKERHMCQMVVHMGLDSIEEVMEGTGNLSDDIHTSAVTVLIIVQVSEECG
jgi:hypothetical protein